VTRAALSVFLCAAALGVGLWAVCLTSANRERAAVLDEEQRWCEAFSRQSDLLRDDVAEAEWLLLTGAQRAEGAEDEPPQPRSVPASMTEASQ